MVDSVDVVLTWVDDSWPGYKDELRKFHGDPRDLNPNRTRDNLGLLRFGLRSLEMYLPNLRRVYLLTKRPQVPDWLDTGREDVIVVHHDEVMAPEHLPTFNSFAIVSHLHLLPGLGERVIYLEDDMMLASAATVVDCFDDQGQPYSFVERGTIPHWPDVDRAKDSPWNLALAHTAEILDARYGARDWPRLHHGPLPFLRNDYAEVMERYREEIAATRAERFRSGACVAPEVLFTLDMMARGRQAPAPQTRPPMKGYASIENFWLVTAAQLKWLDWRNPKSLCLNDSFGKQPNPRVERLVQRWLARRFPKKSRFELE